MGPGSWDLGLGAPVSGFGSQASGLGSGVLGHEFWVLCLGSRESVIECPVLDLRFGSPETTIQLA